MRSISWLVLATAIFGGLQFAASAAVQPPQKTAPVAVVKAMYAWYFAQPGSAAGVHDWWKNLSETKALFDPVLFGLLATASDLRVIDVDPFTNSQSGALAYRIGTPSTKGVATIVPVAIQDCLSCDKPANPSRARAALKADVRKQSDGSYVIYNLLYDGFDLRSWLSKAIAKCRADPKNCP